MNSQDWAIVVGVNSYPGITNLQGPENDAQRFYDWLTSPKGGAIPVTNPPGENLAPGNQAILIKSSDFPASANASTAKPTQIEINAAFDYLYNAAVKNLDDKGRTRIGRRLYLYFAGHGFIPSFGTVSNPHDAALFTANAAYDIPGNHISGRPYAHLFFNSGVFGEIILLMDCCRDDNPNCPPNTAPYKVLKGTPPDLVDRSYFFGFGTKWNRQAHEREMDDGKWHGVFTTALLAGLSGAAADVDTGDITARRLIGYLYNYMKTYFSNQDRNNPDMEKEPELLFVPQIEDENFVITKLAAAPKFSVTVKLSNELSGQQIEIIGERNGEKNLIIDSTKANGADWNCQIEPGLYTLSASGGKKQVIEIIGHITAKGVSLGKIKKVGDEKEEDHVKF